MRVRTVNPETSRKMEIAMSRAVLAQRANSRRHATDGNGLLKKGSKWLKMSKTQTFRGDCRHRNQVRLPGIERSVIAIAVQICALHNGLPAAPDAQFETITGA
jgi:hypothetical protein